MRATTFALCVLGAGLFACAAPAPPARVATKSPAPSPDEAAPRYRSEDAQAELEFATEPSRRIRAHRKSTQRKSMRLHGAQAQPCMFDDCSISDEDDPLARRAHR